jgi:hypothetical protein
MDHWKLAAILVGVRELGSANEAMIFIAMIMTKSRRLARTGNW